ncbi:hypothetical protein Q7P37_002863 [Cladosporium fusiforme]
MFVTPLVSVLLCVSAILSPAVALPSLLAYNGQNENLKRESLEAPTTKALAGLKRAHSFATMDISELSLDENDLFKRRNVDICTRDSGRAAVCVGIAQLFSTLTIAIATNVKSSSGGECEEHSGALDNVHWRVYATGKNGHVCGTTAQLKTIEGAIAKYLRDVDKRVCGVQCIRMTHGGTWTGYVTLSPDSISLDDYYCGKQYTFGDCLSGGEDDRP